MRDTDDDDDVNVFILFRSLRHFMTRTPMPSTRTPIAGVVVTVAVVVLITTAGASAASGLDAGAYVDANVLSAADLGANPTAGRPASEWYAMTAWRDGWYDGISNGGVGLERTVTDADAMYAALEDPRVEFVRVDATFRLDNATSGTTWPNAGATIRRRVTVSGTTTCDDGSSVDGRCAVRCGIKSFVNVVDGGALTLRDVRVETASGSSGGAVYFGRGHGGGTMENVKFASCYADDGGAVFIASDANAKNVTFRNVSFTGNRATATTPSGGRGGAVFVSTTGPAFVVFTSCEFILNSAEHGFGGAVYGEGGGVILNECAVEGNVAASGGGVALRGGGVVSSSTFLGNNATANAGGGLHMTSPTDESSGFFASAVQRTTFTGNLATTAGGGAFVYGRVKMLANSFSGNALPASAPGALDPNYYICTDASSTGCAMYPTLASDTYDPAAYDIFTPQSSFAQIPSVN